MALVAWEARFSVGHDEIDRQHKRLFQMANELHDSMMKGEANSVLGDLLQNLISYTRFHFTHEERVMAAANYPGFAAHRAEHEALTRQVTQICDEFRAGRMALSLKVLAFLKEWLQHHILESDKAYSAHVSAEARRLGKSGAVLSRV